MNVSLKGPNQMGRKENLRVGSRARSTKVFITVNGIRTEAFSGETIHAALLAAGFVKLRVSKSSAGERGAFCGMGVCYECLVTVNGRPNRRACMTIVREGMEITTNER